MEKDWNYIVNHVFIPPRLPQRDDGNTTNDTLLIKEVLIALKLFQPQISKRERSGWMACVKMVRNILDLRDHGEGLVAQKVSTALREMVNGDTLALHIRGQNAGLIIRRASDSCSFESFEVSPTNEAVIGTRGRLRRCFPGPAVAVSQDRIADASFLEPLIELLVNLDANTPDEALPIVRKAGSKLIEIRDTVHPKFVTEMLTGILRAIGHPLDVPRIYKHTRDDVLWKDALKPWRRCPLWLFLRVALQTSLMGNDTEKPHVRYKSFMLFFNAHVLKFGLVASLPSETLFLMTAKISRRALKLEIADGTDWLQPVTSTMLAAQQELSRRWASLEEHTDPLATQRSWNPSLLSFISDTRLTLSRLRPHISKVFARQASPSMSVPFTSKCGHRISQSRSSLPDLNLLAKGEKDQIYLHLLDLEFWVEHFLNDWLQANMERQNACTALAALIDSYISAASIAYSGRPEDTSLMLLTSMDLWVALDKFALHHFVLLHDYSPEFPPSLFEPLLLPKKSQMERLLLIEQYLATRRATAIPGFPSMFRSIDTTKSFAVRYFQQSPYHKELKQTIEAEARNNRTRKKAELSEKRQRYEKMNEDSDRMSCQFTSRWRKQQHRSEHSGSCQKCRLKSQAKGLTIDVHEWPLPERDLEAKAVVFELDVPIIISKWRDTTYRMLVDICSAQSPRQGKNKQQGVYRLHQYAGLQKFVRSQPGRLQLVSTAKPFVISHYRHQKVSQANESTICVHNGLRYAVYDAKKVRWSEELLDCCDVREQCTPRLPAGPYARMQYAVNNTIHTSNEVIARQAECPETLTMHEFYAFGTLRSGHRLQWRNIARELTARILDLNCHETHILLVQAAWQVGPFLAGMVCRESHIDLEEVEFGQSLLSALEDALRTIEGNWQGAPAARTLVALATRLLSFSSSEMVREGCFRVLRRAREISLVWVREVVQKLQGRQGEEEPRMLNARALEMALTCHATFDIDPHHLPDLLQQDDVAIIAECSIIVHDRCPAVLDDLNLSIKRLLQRYRRLSCVLEPYLRQRIIEVRGGLDNTISRLWMGYKPGSSWKALETPSERWLVTETSNKDGVSSMLVHYNLLDGNLLVNGSPLTRLPHLYVSHPTFQRLLGEKVIDVVPSTMSGMVFEARDEIFDHQLFFSMHDSELIIRARRQEDVYELLPVHAMEGDFPVSFAQNYAHWLHMDTGVVEWRPLSCAWTSTSRNWQMRSDGGCHEVLSRGASRLIDLHSPTAKAVSAVLSSLEQATYIHTTLDCETKVLEVHLPRFKLDFFLRKGATELESKQFRGMTVDPNQSIGTLTGLVNKLVLWRHTDCFRSVVVPDGDVYFETEGHHVRVQIDTPSQHLSYHHYCVDPQLGRLIDNGSLRSKLFKCYLHAVTAHPLIDKLTGQTGTEEALSILASPSVQSFLRLNREEIDLLVLLARLTPHRHYYPQHLRVMQEVKWQRISPISQHPSFLKSVQSIFERVRLFDLFHNAPTDLPAEDICGDHHLLERAGVRDAAYRVHGFGAEHQTTKHDANYVARDHVSNSIRESQVCRIAKLVDDWSAHLKGSSQLLHEIESWGKPVDGSRIQDSTLLGYDPKWLDPPEDFLPSNWCTLQTTLSRCMVERDKYRVMIFLSTLMYSRHAKQELVQTLLAFATVSELRATRLPDYTFFELSHGYKPDREKVMDIAHNRRRPFYACPESKMLQFPSENFSDADERRRDEHRMAVEECLSRFVKAIICQWPHENVRDPEGTNFETYIAVDEATADAQIWFRSWYRNAKFKESIGRIQEILDHLNDGDQELSGYCFSQPRYLYRQQRNHVHFDDIMERSAPIISPAPLENFDCWVSRQDEDRCNNSDLKSLLTRLLSSSKSRHEKQYAADLMASYNSLNYSADNKLSGSPYALESRLKEHLTLCRSHVDDVYRTIHQCLHAVTSPARWLVCQAKMWPRVSTTSLLQNLASSKIASLHDEWKLLLIEYGVAISNLQRAERIRTSFGKDPEMLSEIGNSGHQSWNPIDYPDWLLLEIENNILIRPVQAQIAQEMISPSSGTNSILQLNMGEGKSSVIVPIVAAALANGEKLVRVVVLKPLSSQMFQVLLKTLAGMLGRRIFHMPVSRSIRMDNHKARQIQNLCEECRCTGGVLLVQPEHLLSFELIGLERLLSGESELGNKLIQTRRWLEDNSRDILDESDEVLSVRFELIYTLGTQRAIEFGSDRWAIIEHILGLLSRFAPEVLHFFPQGLELPSACPGRFCRMRILQPSAADKLMQMLAREVCETGLPGLPVWNLPQHVRDVLFKYFIHRDMDKADYKLLQPLVFAVDSARKIMLLLKGLIAGGILSFALQQKRWRVDYGLDLSRTMLAVPYRAKDIPSTRSEFGHPDATIVYTCLSYYYGGLSDEQLRTAFEKLLLSDRAQEEYETWVRDAPELPGPFRQVIGVNLSDPALCSQTIFPPLRYAKGAIDFYMSRIVFPKEMREFPHKLSSSGWDIARTKIHPTTGFSGTNDSKYILPLSIEQRDLPAQRQTNAAVLHYLLRPENSFKHAKQETHKDFLDAESLLQIVVRSEPPIRVVLDVGAQVLDWKNVKVVSKWLSRVPEAQAAVFFNERNDLSVLSRDGVIESLMVSPFANQMDQCLVYLDEAHTRGTDLKLPTNYRAAVTLGPGLTKDRLVQACMRMRKLGKGQSVMICGPMEVERQILRCSGKSRCEAIEVVDVLHWSMSETCIHTKKCIPLWATQGMRYQRQHLAWAESSIGRGENIALEAAKSLLEVEGQSLQDRYGFIGRQPLEQALLLNGQETRPSKRGTQLEAIRTKCREFELTSFSSATLREEQERELSPENEREQQVERPLALAPCKHFVHRDVERFILQGRLERDSEAFQPAFELLSSTSAKRYLESKAWPTDLLVTADFARTVHNLDNHDLDSFLRPVHWVVSGKTHNMVDCVILSPFEAQELLPYIRQHNFVTLHVYSPRVNISMRSIDDLSFCAIPAVPKSWPRPSSGIPLNLFAGQLYLRDYEDYLSVCRFLGLGFRPPIEHTQVALDGFISPISRPKFDEIMGRVCPFMSSPVEFLRILMALRRKEQSFLTSHMGRVLHGNLLARTDF